MSFKLSPLDRIPEGEEAIPYIKAALRDISFTYPLGNSLYYEPQTLNINKNIIWRGLVKVNDKKHLVIYHEIDNPNVWSGMSVEAGYGPIYYSNYHELVIAIGAGLLQLLKRKDPTLCN